MTHARNIRFVFAYDGTHFHGWQRQAPGVRSVQEEIEHVLQRVLRHPLHLHGASRTDAGVHARGQSANVHTSSPIPVENLVRAIGHRLPADIALVAAQHVADDFHASRDAVAKLYRYRIFNARPRPAAVLRNLHTWHVWYPLDLDRLRAAGRLLVGRHDFAGFASPGSPRASTVRTIHGVSVVRRYQELVIDVTGDGFLYNQVRNIVGTLVEIGRGFWPVERIGEILEAADRRLAGPTAPPAGLCLEWIRYSPRCLRAPAADQREES